MSFHSEIFDSDVRGIGDDCFFHFINIEALDSNLVELIDRKVVEICEGASSTSLQVIKSRLITFLNTKRGTTTEMGAIAEFFTHLYLNEIGFKQEFLFLNLEEQSIKKGFDGYYSRTDLTWIYESKSGSISTAGISHHSKIREAYADLEGKVSGEVKNNPWQNAYNHASQVDVEAEDSIRKQLKKFADDFTMEEFQEIKNFNIIPGSTIFMDGAWSEIEVDSLSARLEEIIPGFEFEKIHIICVNKASLQLFWDYLNS